MDRLIILVCRTNKSVTLTNYFLKFPMIGRFMPLVSVICRPMESRLQLVALAACGCHICINQLYRSSDMYQPIGRQPIGRLLELV